jgi:acyl-CoA synthetase (AMP-forming)/AMP-acid ligase II
MMGLKQVMVRRFDPAARLPLIQERARHRHVAGAHHGQRAAERAPDRKPTIFPHAPDFHRRRGSFAPPDRAHGKGFPMRVMAGYGLTETSPVATSARKKEHRRLRG